MLSRRILISFPSSIDRRERAVRRGRLDGVVQFDVGQLGAADDAFLRLRRKRVPGVEIVQILLHDDVAAAGESRILLADEHGVDQPPAPRGFSVPSTKPSRSRSSK